MSDYRLRPRLSTIVYEPVAMEQERTFLGAIERVERQAVADDGALVLTTSDGEETRFLWE